MHVLLTGFGPFPGAPLNPTGRLVQHLARSRRLALLGVHISAHVFHTSYDAVDRELPHLLQRMRPDVVLMFGLAARARAMRVEVRARNAITRATPDASGRRPRSGSIAPGGVASLALQAPFVRLLRSARETGVTATVSRDAGRYLCNYLCWRAAEAGLQPGGPKLIAFVHVPKVRGGAAPRSAPLTFGQLALAAEAMARTAIVSARTAR